MTTVTEINNPEELGDLAPDWQHLLRCTPGATFFHSLEWLQVYWRHFGARKTLRVLVVRKHNQVVGILPLVVHKARRSEPCRVLAYPLDHWGNFYSPIGADPAAILKAGLDHVRSTRRDWSFIELNWVDAAADAAGTRLALHHAGFPAVGQAQEPCAIVDLRPFESWEAYLASHGSKWRQNLRQCERKLTRRGRITYVRYRSPQRHADPRWDLYDACEAVAHLSWQGRAAIGTMLNKQADREFFRDCHRTAADCGAVDVNLLYLDGAPVAFSYGYYHDGRVIGIKTAFDPTLSTDGTGRVLQARQIADSLARGDAVYELGPPLTAWKRLWMTDLRRVDCYTHFPTTLAAQLVRFKRAIERWRRPQKHLVAAGGGEPESGKLNGREQVPQLDRLPSDQPVCISASTESS